MKILYAPWREEYTTGTAQGKKGEEDILEHDCVFCTLIQAKNDQAEFIVKRYDHCYLVLNKYPYNAGHLLVIPSQHTQNLYDLPAPVQQELFFVVNQATKIIADVLKPQGVNIGINMGKAAGAGIPSHLHVHILPRWLGDTNFLPTLAGAKPVSTDLTALYNSLLPYF